MNNPDDATPEDPESDGRWLRRERNRAAIVAALLELCNEGIFDASAALIAERAGLSARSLFRHFDDIDDLYRTVCQEQFDRVSAMAQIHNFGNGTTREKIENLVDQRLRIFAASRNIGRVARAYQYRIPAIAKMLAQGRDAGIDAALRHLQPEFDALDATQRITAVNCIDVFCSFEAFDRLFEQGIPERSIRDLLVGTLEQVFTSNLPTSSNYKK